MFKTDGDSFFTWSFNPETWKGEGIGDWYKAWVDNGGKKIALP
jgi:hypothetical protein